MALLCLPTELVEHIAEDLDVESFRSFRLASSLLNQQSLHHFKERFFRQRTVLWNAESLRQLVDVISHPNFGDCLQDLVVDATPRFAIRLWELEKGIIDAAAHQDFDRREELTNRYAEVKEKAEEAAKYWNETRFDQTTLTSIFKKMLALQSITFAYDGMDKHHLLFSRRYCENSQNEMSRPFVSTLAALAISRLAVRTIAIDPLKKYGAISIGRLESISPVLARSDDVFLGLEALKLNLRDWRHPEEGFEPPVGRAPFIVRLLSKFKNIRTLELCCFSCLEMDILHEMARHCKYPRLESCILELFTINPADDLFDFLEPAKSSLRSLCLSHVVLKDKSTGWPDVLRRIASDLTLDRIELKNLFAQLGERIGFEGTIQGCIVSEGPELSKEIEKCAERLVSGQWGPAWHLAAVAYPFIGVRT